MKSHVDFDYMIKRCRSRLDQARAFADACRFDEADHRLAMIVVFALEDTLATLEAAKGSYAMTLDQSRFGSII